MGNEHPTPIALPAKLLIAIFDARDEWEKRPLQDALVHVLEAHGISGVTVFSGVTGYGVHGRAHRKGLIGLPHDKPTALFVIDNDAKLRAVLPTIRPMIVEGIVVLIDAEVIPSI